MFKSWEELTELEQLATTYSDYFKDVNGVRPRFCTNWTVEQYKQAIKALDAEAEIVFAAEQEAYEQAIIRFENTIAGMIEMGADDRETAIRWILDTFDDYDKAYIEADAGYFNYEFHLPYSYNWREGAYKEETA